MFSIFTLNLQSQDFFQNDEKYGQEHYPTGACLLGPGIPPSLAKRSQYLRSLLLRQPRELSGELAEGRATRVTQWTIDCRLCELSDSQLKNNSTHPTAHQILTCCIENMLFSMPKKQDFCWPHNQHIPWFLELGNLEMAAAGTKHSPSVS